MRKNPTHSLQSKISMCFVAVFVLDWYAESEMQSSYLHRIGKIIYAVSVFCSANAFNTNGTNYKLLGGGIKG